jgi:hypothetical protein
MTKFTILISLIFIWLFTVFAPSVISLVNNEDSAYVSLNPNEEEQQEQQEQAKFDDKEEKIFLEESIAQIRFSQQKRTPFSDKRQLILFSHSVEISLPPPEALIKRA